MTHETYSFKTSDGLQLYANRWLPDGAPRAHLVVVHGFAEHSARYVHVAAFFNRHGLAVHALDLRGHGHSEGNQAYVDRFELYLKDLTALLDRVRIEAGDLPVFLFGHSMGGAIVTWYVITRQPRQVSGVLLSGAMLKVNEDISPLLQRLSGTMGAWLPRLKTIRLDTRALSRDPRVVEAYENDPLVYTGPVYARMGAEMLAISRRIQANMEKFDLPVLIMHGGADRLTDPAGSRQLAERAASADKTLKIYEGLYHELVNEPERMQVMEDMLDWMEKRLEVE